MTETKSLNNHCNEEEPLIEELLPSKNPLKLFDIWFKNAVNGGDSDDINVACMSTVSANGQPTCRMVRICSYDSRGFIFYTDYHSRKGRELHTNNKVCLLFYWPHLHAQVRIEGITRRLTEERNLKEWNTRDVDNKIGWKFINQGTVVPNREYLIAKMDRLQKKVDELDDQALSKPKFWGGYIIKPSYFEFWQSQVDKVTDRIVFSRQSGDARPAADGWFMKRLSP